MSRRKKDKVKAARAREAERLANRGKENLERSSKSPKHSKRTQPKPARASDTQEIPQINVDVPLRDSKGKKIPSEAERRKKGELDELEKKTEQERSQKRPRQKKQDDKRKDKARISKVHTALLTIAAHPFIVFLVVVFIIVVGASAAQSLSETQDDPLTGNDKAISLVGITSSAKAVIDDTGKFDGFWSDEETGIQYAKLFDRLVDPGEQDLLESRSQTIDEDGNFSYNAEISTSKDAKASQKALSDAGTELAESSNSAE